MHYSTIHEYNLLHSSYIFWRYYLAILGKLTPKHMCLLKKFCYQLPEQGEIIASRHARVLVIGNVLWSVYNVSWEPKYLHSIEFRTLHTLTLKPKSRKIDTFVLFVLVSFIDWRYTIWKHWLSYVKHVWLKSFAALWQITMVCG